MSYPQEVDGPKQRAEVSLSEKHSPVDDTDKHALDYSHASDGSDSFVEGSEGVTAHELATLRHVRDSLPYSSFLVAFVEFAERCSLA